MVHTSFACSRASIITHMHCIRRNMVAKPVVEHHGNEAVLNAFAWRALHKRDLTKSEKELSDTQRTILADTRVHSKLKGSRCSPGV